MAVWSQKWFIVVPVVGLILGHWSLLMHGERLIGRQYWCVEYVIFRCLAEGGVG